MYVGNERQKLYEALREIVDEISFEELYKKLGWNYDKLFDVCKGVTSEFKTHQNKLLGKLELPELFNPSVDPEFLRKHFTDSLIDLAMLMEFKIPDIKNPKRERNPVWLSYRKMWLNYRGY